MPVRFSQDFYNALINTHAALADVGSKTAASMQESKLLERLQDALAPENRDVASFELADLTLLRTLTKIVETVDQLTSVLNNDTPPPGNLFKTERDAIAYAIRSIFEASGDRDINDIGDSRSLLTLRQNFRDEFRALIGPDLYRSR